MSKKILNLPEKELPICPMSISEISEADEKRIALIIKEFSQGFKFIRKYPKSVTFFGSARVQEDDIYYKKARDLGKKISEELNYTIVTGGGPGIMEAANRGAFEVGGSSLGLTITLPNEQAINPYLTDHIGFYYFFSRKVCLSFAAEAYIFFPGGFGTMDEFFEIITLVQTHKIEPLPAIILFGKEYWKPLDRFIKNELLQHKFIDSEDTELFTITDDEEKIIEIIKNTPSRKNLPYNKNAPNFKDNLAG